jgi:hypothetical protein
VETFYTLSKAEPLQMIWVGVSLLAVAASTVHASRVGRAGLAGAAAAALLVAYATKETTVVLIPISVGWLAVERWWRRRGPMGCARFATTYVLTNLVAALAFAGLRWYYAPLGLAEGTYTRAYSLHARGLSSALYRISAWLLRDFAFLLPLLIAALLPVLGTAAGNGRPAARRLVPYAGLWMLGWLAVYLPWPVTFQYYLLPFALGAAVMGGAILGDLWEVGGQRQRRRTTAAALALLAAAGLLWPLTVLNAVADARVQLAVDRANADLVSFLSGLPRASHLSALKRRPDIMVEHVSRLTQGALPATDTFVATPQMEHEPVPTVRIGLEESGVRHVNATLSALLNGRGELVYHAGERTRVLEVGLHRLLCRARVSRSVGASYCPADRGVIYRRTFVYGWQVHRLKQRTGDRERAAGRPDLS